MDTNFRPDFEPVRYGMILLAAINASIFEDICIQTENCKFTNFYKLMKVAKGCNLIYDRGRTAEKVYRYLESKQRVQFLEQNNQKYITLTRIGQRKYKERLKELIELKFSASSQNRLETDGQSLSLAKSVKIKPRRLTKVKSISNKPESMYQVTGDSQQYLVQI